MKFLSLLGFTSLLCAAGSLPASATPGQTEAASAPASIPLDVSQSAADLQGEPQIAQAQAIPAPVQTEVAQTLAPGRATRSGPSYIAIGGNIGFGGDSALGRGNFVITSKVGLTNNFSARPGVVVGSDTTILLPVTADFPISSVTETATTNVAPYVGGGVAISTGSDSLVRPLITAGVDVPLAQRVTATAGVNIAFFRETEVGLILGVGYNF